MRVGCRVRTGEIFSFSSQRCCFCCWGTAAGERASAGVQLESMGDGARQARQAKRAKRAELKGQTEQKGQAAIRA